MDATIAIIATAVLAALGVFGVLPIVIKKIGAVKETLDVVVAAVVALSDGKVTAEEVTKVKKEFQEAKDAWK